MRKRLLGSCALFVIGVGVTVFVAQHIGWNDVLIALSSYSAAHVAVLFFLTLVMVALGAFRWREVLKGIGVHVPFSTVLFAFVGGFAISFFTPMILFGGELFRAYVLERLHDVPIRKAVASVLVDRLLETTMTFIVIAVGLAVFLEKTAALPRFAGIGCIGIATLVALGAFWWYRRKALVARQSETEWDIARAGAFRFFNIRNRMLWVSLLLSFLRTSINVLRVFLAISFLGHAFGILSVFSIAGFYSLAILVPVPAALGIHDALQAVAFHAFGGGSAEGAAFAFFIRGVELFAGAVGVCAFGYLMFIVAGKSVVWIVREYIASVQGRVSVEKSAGIVVMRKTGEGDVLLLLHYPETRDGKDHWDLPKGHMEPGETEEQTARRETLEETGIQDVSLVPGFREEIRYAFWSGDRLVKKSVVFFCGYVNTSKARLSSEHIGAEWLGVEEALSRLTFETARSVVAKARKAVNGDTKKGG